MHFFRLRLKRQIISNDIFVFFEGGKFYSLSLSLFRSNRVEIVVNSAIDEICIYHMNYGCESCARLANIVNQ